MGLTDSEKTGWQLFAQGIAQALRNVDNHRIQNRPDHKRYALGVVGAHRVTMFWSGPVQGVQPHLCDPHRGHVRR
jgi:hypothetical protein